MSLDICKIRKLFPYFDNPEAGIYLDNAATTHKPKCVIEKIVDFYQNFNSNIHRGIYHSANRATEAVEDTRELIAQFINASSSKEIIFTKGATESINLVANSYLQNILQSGDEVLISLLEHNSNYLPWVQACKQKNAFCKNILLNEFNSIDLNKLESMISDKTKFIAVTYVSNIHGGVMPIKEIVKIAHRHSIKVLVDATQALAHIPIDVQDLDCDFLAASSHKAYGPTGIGILYVGEHMHQSMTSYQTGGGMLENLSGEDWIFSDYPHKFEAGTPNISGILGFGSAINFIKSIGFEKIIAHEKLLSKKFCDIISTRAEINNLQAPDNRCCIISLAFGRKNPTDIAILLDAKNIATRFGKMCCHNYFNSCNINGVLRLSAAIYNTEQEVETAAEQICRLVEKR